MLKTTIVLTNSIDESEKLKSLASFGETTFDLRYMSALELAEYLLQLSGISYKEKFITNDELAAMIWNEMTQISYFKLFTYKDTIDFISTIQKLRLLIKDNEEETIKNNLLLDKFAEKNKAIIDAYLLLNKYKTTNHMYDEIDIIRFALANIKSQENIEFIRYEKSHLRPLEIALLNKAAGKEVPEKAINENDKGFKVARYTKAFGQNNEIDDILYHIYDKKYHFDECLIVSASEANYANTLLNYRDVIGNGFPVTIGSGKLITSTGPGKLLSLINDWEDGHYRPEYLLNIVNDEYFNATLFKEDMNLPEDLSPINEGINPRYKITFESITEIVGNLRVRFDAEEDNLKKFNEYEALIKDYQMNPNLKDEAQKEMLSRVKSAPHVFKFIEIINKGLINFIERYCIINDEKIDRTSLNKILKLLKYQQQYNLKKEDVKSLIASLKVAREKPQPGALYYTTIPHAISCLRKHVFIVGLSANNFPGSAKENPLLLDRDLEQFGWPNASQQEVVETIEDFEVLMEEIKKYNVDVHLSWAMYNSQSLKMQNASSVVFDQYNKENGNNKTILDFEDAFGKEKNCRYIEFFNNDLLPISSIGKALKDNKENFHEPAIEEPIDLIAVSQEVCKRTFSASAISEFMNCEYRFFLHRVLGIEQEKEIDIFEIIPANDYGDIAHELLASFNKETTTIDEFLKRCEKRFKEYFIIHPVDNLALVEKEKENFLKMMQNAYKMEDTAGLAFTEKDKYYLDKKTGITIHGLPDKVIKLKDGTYKVIDYKTGHKVKHFADDIVSMIQCALYSYILNKALKYDVSSFEYHYLRSQRVISSHDKGKVMKDYYDALEATLTKMKQALDTGHFEPAGKKQCESCYFANYCKRKS